MNKWQIWGARAKDFARDILSDERVRERLREIERVRLELEREIDLLRRDLRERGGAVEDDLSDKKAKLDRVRRGER